MKEVKVEGLAVGVEGQLIGETRQKTLSSVREIFGLMKLGMSEQEAIKLANGFLASKGVKKFWHKTHVRFGKSTILSFEDDYLPEVSLKENDMVSIDIGPIWDGIEGDAGDSFVFGEDPEKENLIQSTRRLFSEASLVWKTKGLTGQELRSFCDAKATEWGCLLAPSYVKGHRLAEFPHAFYTKSNLFDLDHYPSPNRWVLEIQLCRKDLSYGAFFEDMLL